MLKGYRKWFPKHSLWPQTWGSSSFLSVLLGSFFSLLSFFFPLNFNLNEKKKTPWFLTCWPDKSGVLVVYQMYSIWDIYTWLDAFTLHRANADISVGLQCPQRWPSLSSWDQSMSCESPRYLASIRLPLQTPPSSSFCSSTPFGTFAEWRHRGEDEIWWSRRPSLKSPGEGGRWSCSARCWGWRCWARWWESNTAGRWKWWEGTSWKPVFASRASRGGVLRLSLVRWWLTPMPSFPEVRWRRTAPRCCSVKPLLTRLAWRHSKRWRSCSLASFSGDCAESGFRCECWAPGESCSM